MQQTKGSNERCTDRKEQLIEYLDGRANLSQAQAFEEHLSACADCRIRVDEFRSLWATLDEIPVIAPSTSFDVSVRERIAAEPARPKWFKWLPSPRLAFAVAALVVLSVWLSSMPRVETDHTGADTASRETAHIPGEVDVRMIRDLSVLENYDVLSKFDVLSELPASAMAPTAQGANETR